MQNKLQKLLNTIETRDMLS